MSIVFCTMAQVPFVFKETNDLHGSGAVILLGHCEEATRFFS